MDRLRYISGAEIHHLRLPRGRLRAALAQAFRLHADKCTQVQPKSMLALGPGHFFQSLCAASSDLGYGAHKWVGAAPGNAAIGLPTINSLIVLSSFSSGAPVAILDGNSITVLRTAAMSALAAEYLARAESASIGFVGCGEQALRHLDAMMEVLPDLKQVVCVSGRLRSAERFAAAARRRGLAAEPTSHTEAALACDVVVTSVRSSGDLRPFLDPHLLRPGSFATAVDLGASWHAADLRALDIIATDDREQAREPSTRSRLAFVGEFDADLSELTTGAAPGRTTPAERAMFMFPGFALADLAVAAEIYEACGSAGRGIELPR